jgi:protein-tyrosine phosphatase
MAKEDGLPKVIVGAEVYFFRGMSQSEQLPELTIGESKCILIEMPPAPWSEEIYRELENIWEKWGITPIVAHIDRYIRPFRTYGIPKRLSRLPVLVQANAEFFLEKATAGMALRMLKAEQIQLLGSDCHNLSSRKPNLGDAVEQIRRNLGDGIPEEMNALANEILGV